MNTDLDYVTTQNLKVQKMRLFNTQSSKEEKTMKHKLTSNLNVNKQPTQDSVATKHKELREESALDTLVSEKEKQKSE